VQIAPPYRGASSPGGISQGANLFVTDIDVQSSDVREPGSVTLFGLAFDGLAAVRRRKQA
jgi:hypothetical protein